MTQIDKTKPVLVTGATGYVAGWLIKKLLEDGITVHAAVRKPENKLKLEHLDKIANNATGTIKYFKADLLQEKSYETAMQSCEVVFHTASPFFNEITDAQKQLIEPAVNGTANVLNSATNVASVKRVVLTSSCAAIYSDASDCAKAPNGILTEEVWNTTSTMTHNPYSLSKTLAEKKAWEIAENQNKFDLVVINPSFVMGPFLNPTVNTSSESRNILKQLGDGTMKAGTAKMGIGVVDVRDVADAHFMAAFTPNANGRYITSGSNTDFLEMAEVLLPKYGNDYPIPTRAMPKWLLWLVGPFVNKLFSRKFIKENVDHYWKADNSKIKNELGVNFRPLQQTMEEAFQSLIDADIFAKF